MTSTYPCHACTLLNVLTLCRRFLYQITVAIDACFRLKRRDVSNEEKDPILGSGWGYFIEDSAYKLMLSGYGDQDAVSTFPPQ